MTKLCQIYHLPLRNEKDGLELELTLDGEVLDTEVVLPVISQTLVEGGVLVGLDVLRVTCPDGLRLVKLFIRRLGLLDLLSLLVLGLLIFVLDFLNLGLLLVILDFLLFFILYLLTNQVLASIKIKMQKRQTFSTSLVTASWMG